MSQNRQAAPRSTNPEDYQRVPRAVAAMPKDFADGFEIAPHRHRRAQLIYATAGTMRISTEEAVWVVPPQRALWMPAGVRHSIVMSGDVTMRTLYLREDAADGMPEVCRVLHSLAAAARADRARDRDCRCITTSAARPAMSWR